MVNATGYLNCYERDELEQWVDEMEDKAYDDDDDDNDLRMRYYHETLL